MSSSHSTAVSTPVDKSEAAAVAPATASSLNNDMHDKIKVEDGDPNPTEIKRQGANLTPEQVDQLDQKFQQHPPEQDKVTEVAIDEVITPLSELEKQQLAENERRIKVGLKAYVEMGLALAAIRDQKLYRAKYSTFDQYADSWEITRQRCSQLILAARAHEALVQSLGASQKLPETERAMRELLKAPDDKRAEILQHVTQNDGVPSVERLKEAREKIAPKNAKKKAAKAKPKRLIQLGDVIKAASRWATFLESSDITKLTKDQRKEVKEAHEKVVAFLTKLNPAA